MNVISPEVSPADDSLQRLEQLADISQRLLERAKALGASQAEVSCSDERGLDVNVRLGEVETVESTRDRGIAVTVYFGQRKGSASTADLHDSSLEATVEQACAIARHTEDDPCGGEVVDLEGDLLAVLPAYRKTLVVHEVAKAVAHRNGERFTEGARPDDVIVDVGERDPRGGFSGQARPAPASNYLN